MKIEENTGEYRRIYRRIHNNTGEYRKYMKIEENTGKICIHTFIFSETNATVE